MTGNNIERIEKVLSELQAIIDAMPAYVYVKDPENRFLRGNLAFASYLGLDVREIPGKYASDLLSEEVADRHRKWDKEVIDSGEPLLGVEEQVRRADGTEWFSTDRVPLRNTEGETIGVVCISMDITTQKTAEEALAESEERLQGFYDAAIEGIVVVEKGRLIDVNRRFTEIVGYGRDALIGMEVVSLVHDDDVALVTEHIRGGYEEAYEARIIRKDGSILFVEVQGRTMHLRGRPVRVTTVNDVTERKFLQAQFLHAQKMESIGTLAGGIAHDFNNILTPIMASVGYLQLHISADSPLHEDLHEITQAAERARELVKQILAFGRREEVKRQPVNPTSVVRDALKLLRASFPATIHIREEIDDTCGHIIADPSQLHQVLMNLGTNASQAMGDREGVLRVGLDTVELNSLDGGNNLTLPDGTYAVITVSDTGCGMDDETRSRIFEPYFTTKRAGEGSGLGLAVLHGIVTAHGGEVTVRSKPGEGSSFSVYLPVSEGKEPQAVERRLAIPTGNERILLVDDEAAIVHTTGKILTGLGYDVTSFTDSREALDMFRKSPWQFDLILTDQTLPGMTGSELTREALRIRPDIPVIICTGFSRSINEEKAVELGARMLLSKPFALDVLAEAVRKALTQPVPGK